MNSPSSLMLQETEQSPAVVTGLLEKEAGTFSEIARIFQKSEPAVITTAARGSSDHAATFFKYLMEITMGIPVASIGPSVASVYGSKLKLKNGLHFTVSQSGASPDIVAAQEAAKKGGATTVAVVNVVDSPLGKAADIVLALNAGEEKALPQPSRSSPQLPHSRASLLRPVVTQACKRDCNAYRRRLQQHGLMVVKLLKTSFSMPARFIRVVAARPLPLLWKLR